MRQLQTTNIQCPYCGEALTVQVDLSVGDQAYIEDCQVCCRPIEMRLAVSGTTWTLEANRDDE